MPTISSRWAQGRSLLSLSGVYLKGSITKGCLLSVHICDAHLRDTGHILPCALCIKAKDHSNCVTYQRVIEKFLSLTLRKACGEKGAEQGFDFF